MKNAALALLVLSLMACSRDTVERSTPPLSSTAPANDTAITTPETRTTTPETGTSSPTPGIPVVSGPTLAFVDEAASDPSFVAYRDRLLAAVRASDAKSVVALADPKVRTSFGDDGGRASLEKLLARPGMFDELERLLTLGGSFQGESRLSFWAPYVYSTYPDKHDPFTTVAILGDSVPLRASADSSAPVLATLSHNIVERVSSATGDQAWTEVKTGQHAGFVESKFVRSPIDYRAGFNKTAAGWQMTALVAGD